MLKYQIRKQVSQNLNYQYKTTQFSQLHSFQQLISICQSSLRKQLYPTLYQLPSPLITKYSLKINYCPDDPFPATQRHFLSQLSQTCDQIIADPSYDRINQASIYATQGKLSQLQLTNQYKRFQMDFRYINIKQAMIYIALSQCNVWYTICKTRKNNLKTFNFDHLIEYFNTFIKKLNLQNPYHFSILPKKQLKQLQRKTNKQKIANPLHQAVSQSNYNQVKQLLQSSLIQLQSSIYLSIRNKIQIRCTHRACLNSDLKMCKILHSFGANWQAQDGQKMSPIFYAVQGGSLPVLKYLIQEIKVNIEKQQMQKRTPFYWACTQGDINIIHQLYQAGCDINHKSQLGRTALSKACYLGRLDVVLFLLSCKEIDLYSQCKKGRTALHNAVFGPKGGREGHKFGTNEKDSPECAQALLQKGFNVDYLDYQNFTSLHIAASSQAIDSIRLLLSYNASLLAKNTYGEIPLMAAAKFGHIDACKILYEQYHSNLMCTDIFNKNLLLLAAKFQLNPTDPNPTINPAFLYFLQPFIKQCIKQNNIKQLHRTLLQLIKFQQIDKIIQQFTQLINIYQKYNITLPSFNIIQIQIILKLVFSIHEKNAHHNHYIPTIINLLKAIQLPQQQLKQLHTWIIKYNSPQLLNFISTNNLLFLSTTQLNPHELFTLISNDQLSLKQKVITFCLLSLNFNWIAYRTKQNSNILHLLVRKQKSGCIIQLFKALLGKIPQNIIANTHLKQLSLQQTKKILKTLLQQTDQSALNAYQLSLILKNKSVAKLIQQKLKQQNYNFPKCQIQNNILHQSKQIQFSYKYLIIINMNNKIIQQNSNKKYVKQTIYKLYNGGNKEIISLKFYKKQTKINNLLKNNHSFGSTFIKDHFIILLINHKCYLLINYNHRILLVLIYNISFNKIQLCSHSSKFLHQNKILLLIVFPSLLKQQNNIQNPYYTIKNYQKLCMEQIMISFSLKAILIYHQLILLILPNLISNFEIIKMIQEAQQHSQKIIYIRKCQNNFKYLNGEFVQFQEQCYNMQEKIQ